MISKMTDDAPRNERSLQYTNSLSLGAKVSRRLLRGAIQLLPPDAPAYIYTKILKPRPLRNAANAILRKLIPRTVTLPEGELLLNPSDPVVSGALMLGAFEKHFSMKFRESLQPGMTVVDIGANIGYYTLIASKGVGKEGKVISYEPEPENLGFLVASLAHNLLGNILVVKSALGAHVGEMTLYVDPDNKGKHTLLPVSGSGQIRVAIDTLDRSLSTLGVSHVDVIKMDIEGWESKAFHGMQLTLDRDHPKIFFEFAPERIRETGDNPSDMLLALRTREYTLEVIDERSGALLPVHDPKTFIATLHGYDGYANIVATWQHTS